MNIKNQVYIKLAHLSNFMGLKYIEEVSKLHKIRTNKKNYIYSIKNYGSVCIEYYENITIDLRNYG